MAAAERSPIPTTSIFTAEARSGHGIYAKIIEETINSLRISEEEGGPIIYDMPLGVGPSYDWILSTVPAAYALGYEISDHLRPLRQLVNRNLRRNEKVVGAVEAAMEESKERGVDFIYIAHPLLLPLARDAQEKSGFIRPLVCSLQELTKVHRQYFDGHRRGLDCYLANTQEMADFAIKCGIPAADFAVVGYRPRQEFLEVAAVNDPVSDISIIMDRRLVYRRTLKPALEAEAVNRPDLQRLKEHLDPGKALVLVTGWTDGQWGLLGRFLKALKANLELKDKVQVAVLCGKDVKYFNRLMNKIESNVALNKDGWLDEVLFPLGQSSPQVVANLLRAVGGGDGVLLAASAGPNFLLEALTEYVYNGVIWRAIPGQEPANALWAHNKGLATYFNNNTGKAINCVLERLSSIINTDIGSYPPRLRQARMNIIENAEARLIKALIEFSSRRQSQSPQSS
jgi:hypothetical protein